MSVVRVYSAEVCPHCKLVKEFLMKEGIEFEDVEITDPEALTELRMNGVFTLVTPVVQVGSEFFTHEDLFDGDELMEERFRDLLRVRVARERR